jgi:DNA-directed RNA polymerase I subunit RPA2
MLQKLFSLVEGKSSPDNSDSPMNHEVLLPGHLYLLFLKDKLRDWLNSIKATLLKEIKEKNLQSVEGK